MTSPQESIDRFRCPCCNQNLIDLRVVDIHERVEAQLKRKLPVNSGYRCKKHNEELKASPTSSHTRGLADDIDCDDSPTRFLIIKFLISIGVTRIGLARGFLHFDIDRQKDQEVAWFY